MHAKNLDELQEGDSLIEKGVLDSLSILTVVAFLEKEFKIKIDDLDLLPENFETINNIDCFVTTKIK